MVKQRSVPREHTLERAAREEWEEGGAHRVAVDPKHDLAVLLVSDSAPASQAFDWLGAMDSVMRPRGDGEGPAFRTRVALASTRLSRRPATDPMALPAPPASAKLKIAKLTISGRVEPPAVSSAIEAQRDRLLRCYGIGLRANPKLAGKVTARFVIGVDGGIGTRSAQDVTLDHAETVSCVLDALRFAELPAPKGGIVTVMVPLTFAPR